MKSETIKLLASHNKWHPMELCVCFDETNIFYMPSGYVRQIASVPKCCGSQTGTNVNVVLALICTCVPPAKEYIDHA